MSMQDNIFRGPATTTSRTNRPNTTNTRGGGAVDSYDSFIDFDGFPSTTRTNSFQTHNTQTTHSTANTSLPMDSFNNVRTLNAENAVVMNLDGVGGIGMGGVSEIGWEEVVRFPQHHPKNQMQQQQSQSQFPMSRGQTSPYYHQQQHNPQIQKNQQQQNAFMMHEKRSSTSSRDQQIFRRTSGGVGRSVNGVGNATLGDAATYSSSSRSNDGPNNDNDNMKSRGSSANQGGTIGSKSYSKSPSPSQSANSNGTSSNNSLQGGGIIFESYEAIAARTSEIRGGEEGHGILDNIHNARMEALKRQQVQHRKQPTQQLNVHNLQQPQFQKQPQTINNNATKPSSSIVDAHIHKFEQNTPSSSSAAAAPKPQPVPIKSNSSTPAIAPRNMEDATNSSSISPATSTRKLPAVTAGGVVNKVNKLVAMFSNKATLASPSVATGTSTIRSPTDSEHNLSGSISSTSNQPSLLKQPLKHVGRSSPLLKRNSGSTPLSSSKQSPQPGVQFQVPANNHSRKPTLQIDTNNTSSDNNHHPTNASFTPTNPNSYPPISPARSNAQSSVTGASGESSSYCPSGWPGTVDKRGKTYQVQPSYSESEESSASPQRSVGWNRGGGGGGRFHQHSPMGKSPRGGGNGSGSRQYPMQQYRSDQEEFSFDGDSAAELENWMKGDGESYVGDNLHGQSQVKKKEPMRSGPVDLDEAYERRSDIASNHGWRDGRQESLAGISEAKTAADFALEAALGIVSAASNPPPQKPSLAFEQSWAKHSLDSSGHIEVDEDGFPSPNTSRLNKSLGSCHSSQSSMLEEEYRRRGIDTSLSEKRVLAAGRRLPSPKVHDDVADFDYSPPEQSPQNRHRQPPPLVQPPTEEALRWKDSRNAPHRPGGSVMMRGYRGFIDKTKDVPNLMDDLESEASTSLGTKMSVYSEARRAANMGLALPPTRNNSGRISPRLPPSTKRESPSNVDSESDVFDGVESSAPSTTLSSMYREEFGPVENQILNVSENVAKPNNYQQSSSYRPERSAKASLSQQSNPFVTNQSGLDISAISHGSTNAPSQHDFDEEFDEFDDDFESLPDLARYAIDPDSVRSLVRTFRKICTSLLERSMSGERTMYDIETLEDTKKTFALFEMRSRIMETDIDRGLERRGGTNVVDDIVLTPYFQASQRVRDAVIVSKAWRDGATPKDVVTAHLLTRRSSRAYFVRRPMRRNTFYIQGAPYWREEVSWIDDTDFELMRCQSLGAGTMKGFEMFTIGDCQSILLKTTSDNCMQLRRELRMAMMRQIEAEERMQEEIDLDNDEDFIADAEQIYRDATVEVKSLSVKLVLADKAFTLVRGRMEKLVATIESLLVQIENDQAANSKDEDSASDSQDEGSFSSDDEGVEERMIERAKRAELAAEVAVREAKLEAERVSAEKQREIDMLKEKLAEMETRSEYLANENRRLAVGSSFLGSSQGKTSYLDKLEAKSILNSTFDKDLEDARAAAKERAKQRFKASASKRNGKQRIAVDNELNGEEIYNHLDFYSRSLKSVAQK